MARRLIDRNRAREARRQARLFDALTRQFRGKLANELAAAMREMADHWDQTQTVVMPRDFRARIEATYQQMALAAITTFGTRILKQAKGAGVVLERKDFATTMTNLALRYIRQEAIRKRITDVTETTRRQVIGVIKRGYDEGMGTAEIGRAIRDVIDEVSRWRAETIARTETHGAANFGSDAAAQETGLPLRREWLAAQDERTRDTHRTADGQVVGADQAFQVGDASLMYPGDPAGPPEETINCRCSLGYILDDLPDPYDNPAGLS